MRVFMLLGTANEAVLREGTEASVDGSGIAPLVDPVVPSPASGRGDGGRDFAFRLVYAVCAPRGARWSTSSPPPLPWPRLAEELAAAVWLSSSRGASRRRHRGPCRVAAR